MLGLDFDRFLIYMATPRHLLCFSYVFAFDLSCRVFSFIFVDFVKSESAPAALTMTLIFLQCLFCKCSAMIRPKMVRNRATEHPRMCRRSNRAQTKYAGADYVVEKVGCEAWGSILTMFRDFPGIDVYTHCRLKTLRTVRP